MVNKHLIKEGSRDHILFWDSQGRHCSEPECEVNEEVKNDVESLKRHDEAVQELIEVAEGMICHIDP